MKTVIILCSILIAPLSGFLALQTGVFNSLQQTLQVLLFAWPASIFVLWVVLSYLTGVRIARRPSSLSWSPLSKLFHWVMALSILGTTALMFYMINIGDLTVPVNRAEYSKLLKTHKSLGLLVMFLVALRFAWNRWKTRPPLPTDLTRAQVLASRASHLSLYVLMLTVPLLGWMASMTYGGRTHFFGLFELPIWLPKNIEWANVLQPAHIWLAYGMLGIVGIHALAALWHHFAHRDATLVQMMPGRSDSRGR